MTLLPASVSDHDVSTTVTVWQDLLTLTTVPTSLVNEQLIIIFTRIIVTLTHNRANYNFSNTVASLTVLWPA